MVIGEFSDVFPPELDGVGTVVKNYVTGLNGEEDTCYYIAPRGPKGKNEREFPTLLCRSVKLPREPYHVGLPRLDAAFRRKLEAIPFDVVHAHSPFAAGAAARRVARRLGIPLVATFHSKYYDDFLAKTHSKTLARLGTKIVVRFYNSCDEVWAVNEATAEVLRGYGYRGPIRVMKNGTDPWIPGEAKDPRVAQIEALAKTLPLFLFVGQINRKKGLFTILDAFRRHTESEKAELILVGQGPDEGALKAYAEELGIAEHVHFLGHMSDRESLMHIYAAATLFLFPSVYDNAPMVVREAAAAGVPSILIQGSCAAEGVTDGENGFLCENNAESLAEAITRALPLAKEVGERARESIPARWRDILAEARARYAELINEKKAKQKKEEGQ